MASGKPGAVHVAQADAFEAEALETICEDRARRYKAGRGGINKPQE